MRTIPALSLVLVAALALTGCSAVESAIEGATGGEVDLGGQSIPDGFPTDEVPLTPGDILLGSTGSKDGRTVYNIIVDIDSVDTFPEITTQLTDAGFVAEGDASPTSALMSSDLWTVLVVVVDQPPVGAVANYTVTAKF